MSILRVWMFSEVACIWCLKIFKKNSGQWSHFASGLQLYSPKKLAVEGSWQNAFSCRRTGIVFLPSWKKLLAFEEETASKSEKCQWCYFPSGSRLASREKQRHLMLGFRKFNVGWKRAFHARLNFDWDSLTLKVKSLTRKKLVKGVICYPKVYKLT